jgi:choline kinase|tara:strand:+ start:542 stop:1255 length:714 start_codon:yes stop_codon:yes gene_type:complete
MKFKNTTNIRGKKSQKYSIIIPSAGMGKRMRSYGPKSLIKITPEKNIVENQIEIINDNFTNHEIILVCGFEADKLMNNTPKNLIKIENENYENTNVVRSIGLGLRAATSENVLVIYGDLVFNEETIKNLKPQCSSLIIDNSSTMKDDEVGCNISNNYVEQMLPDIENKWAQIAFLIGDELEMFKKICWNRDKSHYFGFEAMNEIIEKGGKFKSLSPQGMKITDVDSSKDLATAREIL